VGHKNATTVTYSSAAMHRRQVAERPPHGSLSENPIDYFDQAARLNASRAA
jgi:hypothetical protein